MADEHKILRSTKHFKNVVIRRDQSFSQEGRSKCPTWNRVHDIFNERFIETKHIVKSHHTNLPATTLIVDYVSVGEMMENGHSSKSIFHHNPTDTYAILLSKVNQNLTTKNNVTALR